MWEVGANYSVRGILVAMFFEILRARFPRKDLLLDSDCSRGIVLTTISPKNRFKSRCKSAEILITLYKGGWWSVCEVWWYY